MITEQIEIGDEIVLQVNPWQREVVRVKRVAGLGLWVTECGMYFQRGDTVEMFKKRPEPSKFSWLAVWHNAAFILLGISVILLIMGIIDVIKSQ